jgi:hypothetical protein
MVTKHEEQLNRYFEHALSPKEEQNFLISVAASDALRIAFRSQLELMKAVRTDKDALHSGMNGQPVARVRDRTLVALGLSATAATPFIEQELMRESRGNAARGQHAETASMPGGTVMPPVSWIGRALRTPALTLATGLAAGILSTMAVERFNAPINPPAGISYPSQTVEQPKALGSPSAIETIPAANGLVNSSHSVRAAAHHAGQTPAAGMGQTSARAVAPNAIPELSKSKPGIVGTHKAKITRPNDSVTAK